ncbi:hypothetical protein F183_A34300 [Bryobacterales bacterium F-183]|nr:hypothetical protein F183_A34300 [Bryobacterales bacterium F-183]
MSDLDDDLREEIETHLAMRAEHDRSTREQARKRFGNQGQIAEEMRWMHVPRWLDEVRQDLRYAIRGIRHNPGFTATAVSVLGLAIAAVTTLFTLYSNYVLKPMPIRGADRNYYVGAVDAQGRRSTNWSYEQFRQLEAASVEAFEGLYGENLVQTAVLRPVQTESFVSFVSPGYFGLTGARLLTGRFLSAQEERDGTHLLLSHSGWRRLLHEDPEAVGKTLQIRATRFTIAGILDPAFTGTEPVIPDFWIPLSAMDKVRVVGFGRPFVVSGILKPGVTAERARQMLEPVGIRIRGEGPAEQRITGMELTPRHSFIPQGTEVKLAAAMVFAIFLLVLLIACANLANLQLARAAARRQEIEVRLSLGASRWRIVRQLLTESAVVGVLAAMLGLLAAAFGVLRLQDYLFSEAVRWGLAAVPASLDWRVFVFSAGIALVSGVAFGLLPALEATASARKQTGFRMRGYLISGQAAASLVLLILSALLIRNTQRLYQADAGFDLDRVMELRWQEVATPAFVDRLRADPLIAEVSVQDSFPLSGSYPRAKITTNGAVHLAGYNEVDDRYFAALGLKITQGRGFVRGSQEAIAVVSEATARRLWPGQNVLGQTLVVEDGKSYQVAGVVPDVVSGWMFQGKDPTMIYVPVMEIKGHQNVAVRAAGDVQTVKRRLREYCVTAESPNVCQPMTAREVAGVQRFPFQAAAMIASGAGAIGLLLTCIGLFGVVSYMVVQRSREIGIHLALGAQAGQVVGRFVRDAFGWVLLGIVVGMPVCLALSAVAASKVFALDSFDAAAYLVTPTVLVLITLLSCFLPARRASRVDPMISLRHDG